MKILFDLREDIGSRLLLAALRVLPATCALRIGAVRGLQEQREYERYVGYTIIARGNVMPFRKWREIWGTMRLHADMRA